MAASSYEIKKAIQDKIEQLDAILANGAERVPTDLGPIQYNLVEANKERARLMAELARLETSTNKTRMIRVFPVRT